MSGRMLSLTQDAQEGSAKEAASGLQAAGGRGLCREVGDRGGGEPAPDGKVGGAGGVQESLFLLQGF